MNLDMDIQSINIPNLIKNGQYYQHISTIKNYEDTLQKLLSNNKNTEISNEPYAFIWEIDKNLFPDFKNNLTEIGGEVFGETFSNLDERIVITGPLVRSCLINTTSDNKSVKLINELYLFRCCEENWDDILDLSVFIDKKSEYVFEDDKKKITLIKRKFKHPTHVILQYDYLKRVGYCNGLFYGSSMFLLEMQKHFTLINSKFKDPILNIPYDPLGIYKIHDKDDTHPLKVINMIDINELSKLSKKSLLKLYSHKTCIELCLDKLADTDHPVLINQLKHMIAHLGNCQIKRPPYLYAKLLGINVTHPDVYTYLKSIESQYKLQEIIEEFKSLEDINLTICNELSKEDNVENFFDFIGYVKMKINKTVLNILIKNESTGIIEHIVKKNIIDTHLMYHLVLMTEDFDLLKFTDMEIEIDLALNYLKDILQNGKTRSFYYLYERDKTIITTLFEENKNVLHMVKLNKETNHSDLIELIITLKPELLNLKDLNKETPVVYHSKHNPEIIKIFLEYEFDYTITDSDGNCFIHCLCANDCPDILKLSLKRCPELIDMPNKRSETPLILCGINNLENMYYVLKGMGADINAQDLYGNTVSHYICSNSMCLGMIIENKQNYFGLKPSDYCKVSEKYYNFI